jgi:hypothetical protein
VWGWALCEGWEPYPSGPLRERSWGFWRGGWGHSHGGTLGTWGEGWLSADEELVPYGNGLQSLAVHVTVEYQQVSCQELAACAQPSELHRWPARGKQELGRGTLWALVSSSLNGSRGGQNEIWGSSGLHENRPSRVLMAHTCNPSDLGA